MALVVVLFPVTSHTARPSGDGVQPRYSRSSASPEPPRAIDGRRLGLRRLRRGVREVAVEGGTGAGAT